MRFHLSSLGLNTCRSHDKEMARHRTAPDVPCLGQIGNAEEYVVPPLIHGKPSQRSGRCIYDQWGEELCGQGRPSKYLPELYGHINASSTSCASHHFLRLLQLLFTIGDHSNSNCGQRKRGFCSAFAVQINRGVLCWCSVESEPDHWPCCRNSQTEASHS